MTDKNAKNAETDTEDEDDKLNWARLPKAKRHSLLTDIQTGLKGCHKTGVFQVFGTWYKLRSLDPLDEDWTLQYLKGNDLFSAAKSKRGPSVAAAMVAIGKSENELVPIAELFEVPADLPVVHRRLIESSEYIRRDWLRSEVLRWLHEPESHETLIAALYDKYLSLEKARNEALGALDPLSKSAQSGASSNTSSQEKESSSATPASPG